MVVPVSGTLPDSTLTPRQVRQKFSPQTLAGLGDCTYDDFTGEFVGDCSGSTSGTLDFQSTWGQYATQPDGSAWPFDPGISVSQPTVTSTYMDGGGDIVAVLSDGSTYTLSPGGNTSKGGGGSPSTGKVTQQQASAWPAMISALSQAGVKLGTVALLPAGTSLLPNGTIVGSGQSLIRPGVVTSSSLSSTLNGLFSNPMVVIGGFGILALALFAGGGRR